MLIDLHTHTSHLSMDSALSIGDLVSLARERGLDGICLTEHNAVWEPIKLAEMRKKYDFPIFSGMEVGTDKGHVLVFGLERFTLDLMTLRGLRAAVEEAGAAMILAHPHRKENPQMAWQQLPLFFHGVETLNGCDANSANAYVASLAASVGLPGTGGSDAHSEGVVGSCATYYERPIRSDAELVSELLAGRIKAVDLRNTSRQSQPQPGASGP